MTPKEKAKELYLKMLSWEYDSNKYIENNIISSSAKQCALIAVDEIIEILENDENIYVIGDSSYIDFWKAVKQEIEKL